MDAISRRVLGAYGLFGLVLWPIPLLNVLQVESAAVVAFTAFFVAGWASIRRFAVGEASFWRVLGRQEAALFLPLVLLLVAQLWAPNCTLGQGLLFYGLFPGVTVVFVVAVAYAITGVGVARPVLVLVGLGLTISLLGPLYDLGFHPQFYTYNHVFGGVLGPIYDEQLAVRPGLFVFRGLTLLWAVVGVGVGRWGRGRGGQSLLGAGLIVIAGVYGWAAPMGINTTPEHLQQRLGGHVQTEHVDLYYDATQEERRAMQALAADHEAYYSHLQEQLGLSPDEGPARIQSYLYPNPDVKAALTGARTTSVAPVWLGTPQVHLLTSRAETSLGHELAHVFSRPYGLPGLHASWSPGLVEGWAVALEPPDASPSAHELVRVAATTDTTTALSVTAEALADRLTPWGFWTGRGAVSYATMGSFVRYLLDRYGPNRLKQVYARGNFAAVYGRSLDQLVEGWQATLTQAPMVSRAAHEIVTRQFSRPSLFETDCPHYVPPHRRQVQAAQRAARRGDSSRVTEHLHCALAAAPAYTTAHAMLAQRRLAQGRARAVHRQLDTLSASRYTPLLHRLRADAYVLTGEPRRARRQYRRALRALPLAAHDSRARVLLRVRMAGRPAVVRTLTNTSSPAAQATTLAQHVGTPVGRAWQALRFQDAHRYARADSVWQTVPDLSRAGWVRGERRDVVIQRRAWAGEAAARAGRSAAAGGLFRTAARAAGRRGATAWATALQFWAQRTQWGQGD